MDAKIQKQLIDYFTHLSNAFTEIQRILSECQKVSISLQTLLERHKRLQRANICETPLECLPKVLGSLSSRIILAFNENISTLQEYNQELNKMYEDLKAKKGNLDSSCDSLDFSLKNPLIDGSAYQPKLSELLEFSQDGSAFVLGICAQINYAIFSVGTKNSKIDFNDYFKIDPDTNLRIQEICRLTQYCNKTDL